MSKLSMIHVRRIALSLNGAVEQDHHGVSSFRVNDRIFATLWDDSHVNITLSPLRIVDTAKENPNSCREFWWGWQLRCLQVDLEVASLSLVKKLLSEAWATRKVTKPYRIASKGSSKRVKKSRTVPKSGRSS
jgi:hypothetical protein